MITKVRLVVSNFAFFILQAMTRLCGGSLPYSKRLCRVSDAAVGRATHKVLVGSPRRRTWPFRKRCAGAYESRVAYGGPTTNASSGDLFGVPQDGLRPRHRY